MMSLLTFYFNTEEYGLIQIANSIIRLFEVLISFGTIQYLLTKIYDQSYRTKLQISFSSFVYFSFFLVIIYAIVVLFFYFNNHTILNIPILYFCFFPFISFLLVLYELLCSLLIYDEYAKKYSFLTIIKLVFEFLFICIFIIILDFGWFARIGAMFFSISISIVFFIRYLKKSNYFSKKVEFKTYLRNTKEGFPLVLLSISILVFDLSDRFFIERMLGLKETGLYSVAYTYSSIVMIIGGAIINAIRPRIYKYLTDKNKSVAPLFIMHFSLILIIAIIVVLFKGFVFGTFFNKQYFDSIYLTNSLVLGFIFWNFYLFFNSVLVFYNKNYLVSGISLCGILINLFLNYYLINLFGVIGASYATLISCIMMFSISFLFSYIILKKNLVKNIKTE